MEFDRVISERKSVRRYLKKAVSKEAIQNIILAGNKAPVACRLQALSIIEIREEPDKKSVVKTTYRGSLCNDGEGQVWMLEAPIFLIICVDMDKCRKRYGEEDYKKTAYLNVSASIENMLLKAVDLGLGCCYVTGFRERELSRCLNIRQGREIVAILTVGYEDGRVDNNLM